MEERDYPYAPALSPADSAPPQFANAARAWSDVAGRRVASEMDDQFFSLRVREQLAGPTDELRRFDDRHEGRYRHGLL